jgi:hypothetical protein
MEKMDSGYAENLLSGKNALHLKIAEKFGYSRYSFDFAHWFFGRALGLVSLCAFLSYWVQADALIGNNGIAPWSEDLEKIEQITEQNPTLSQFSLRPTLLWFSIPGGHTTLFVLGSLSSLALTIGWVPLASAIVSYITYLSLMVVGEPFLSFQWDILLVETLLLAFPFLPMVSFHRLGSKLSFSNWSRLLLVALLAKLMLESGIVKFTSFAGDGTNTWRELTALAYHYWTQPLPHGLSRWVHSLPSWFDSLSLYSMYIIELALPLCFFLPGNIRRVALIGQVLLQLAILFSGNYGFFNLLTLCLCIPLLDDQVIPSAITNRFSNSTTGTTASKSAFRTPVLFLLFSVFLATSYGHILNDLKGNKPTKEEYLEVPQWIQSLQAEARTLRCFNSYGLFRVMTTIRPEIIIEGSMDGKDWQPYEFKWKPGNPNRATSFAGPHMPRLDWQMWFEGLNFENYTQNNFTRFLYFRFLQISANGGNQDDFANFKEVLGEKEFFALSNSPTHIQEQVLRNYNQLLGAFLGRSQWFGNFLEALLVQNENVLSLLDQYPEFAEGPNQLRVTLRHYKFSGDIETFWETGEIPKASLLIEKK